VITDERSKEQVVQLRIRRSAMIEMLVHLHVLRRAIRFSR
jgi:hypothetical protein